MCNSVDDGLHDLLGDVLQLVVLQVEGLERVEVLERKSREDEDAATRQPHQNTESTIRPSVLSTEP